MNLTGWADAAWADGSWVPASWGITEVEPQPDGLLGRSGGGKKKYRLIGDLDRLYGEIKEEEVKVEKQRKKLKILIKRQVSKEGIYKDLEPQIQAVEKVVDDRLAKIAMLFSLIQSGFDAIAEDDEEVLLLS